jgi:hypothetical protein
VSPAGEAHIDLCQIEFQFRSNKKVNSEIHFQCVRKRSSNLSFVAHPF